MLNPAAGKGVPEDLGRQIESHFSGKELDYRLTELGENEGPEKIKSEIAAYGPTIVVAAGGDGTVSLVADKILGKEISLGILPLGSSNALAYQFGIPDDPSEALRIIAGSRSRSIDVIRINERYYCLHMSDLGMNARVIRRYEQENIRGFYGYARQYIRELGNREKFRVHVSADGSHHSVKAVMVVLSNAPHYGTGAKIAPEGKPDDGWFEVIAIRSYPFWFLFYMLLSIFTGKVSVDRFSTIIKCREAHVTVTPPQDMQVDGEFLGSQREVNARIIAGGLKILSP